jgi:hypothetical protein
MGSPTAPLREERGIRGEEKKGNKCYAAEVCDATAALLITGCRAHNFYTL